MDCGGASAVHTLECRHARYASAVLSVSFPHFRHQSLLFLYTPFQIQYGSQLCFQYLHISFALPSHPACSILGQKGGENW